MEKSMFLLTISIRFNMKSKQEIITICYASQKSNLNLQKKYFYFYGEFIYNKLPKEIRSESDFEVFSTKLNSFNLT